MSTIEIGRILRANTTEFVVGCRVNQLTFPSLGSLVKVTQSAKVQIYGIVYNIQIADDGLIRQLVVLDNIDESIIADNRQNRNIPIEMSVLSVGYNQDAQIHHLLPPRPPLTLESITLCDPKEIYDFTNTARLGYFRHIIRAQNIPVGEILSAHLQQADQAHQQEGDQLWLDKAVKEIISSLRDDYDMLMTVLKALAEIR
jgi:hypothetical protein